MATSSAGARTGLKTAAAVAAAAIGSYDKNGNNRGNISNISTIPLHLQCFGDQQRKLYIVRS